MAILKILQYPDARLHSVAKSVETIDDKVRTLISSMAETMYSAPGVGLAATQVGVLQRIVVIDVSETKNQLLALINPEIVSKTGVAEHEEGCLSVPGIYETVQRAERVTVKAQDLEGKFFEFEADGLLGVCVQHEIDHLDGKVFVEYLSRLKQVRILTKLKKLRREAM